MSEQDILYLIQDRDRWRRLANILYESIRKQNPPGGHTKDCKIDHLTETCSCSFLYAKKLWEECWLQMMCEDVDVRSWYDKRSEE